MAGQTSPLFSSKKMSNTVATVAVVLSGVALLPILFGGLYLYNDINNFYVDTLEELHQFRSHADGAWSVMVTKNYGRVNSFAQLIGRNKRSGDNCNCGRKGITLTFKTNLFSSTIQLPCWATRTSWSTWRQGR